MSGQYEAGEEEHLTGLFRADVAEGTGQPVHGERQADGDDGAPNMTIRPPILVLSRASRASGTRKRPRIGAEHKHEPKQSEDGDAATGGNRP